MPNSAILRINAEKDSIETNPEYQRKGDIWTLEKKQLLIDSILNDYDIPKIYLQKLPNQKRDDGKKYELAIIDGRQRLETIWAFINGDFALAEDFKYFKDDNVEAAKLTYPDLAKKYPKLKITFDSFVLPIILVDTDDLDLIEDMFSRLNEAVPLNAAEKRNALGGPMVRIINRVSSNNFFGDKVSFSNKRYQHKEVSARLLFIEYSLRTQRRLIDTKKLYLDNMVKDYRDGKLINPPDEEELGNTVEGILYEMNSVFINKDSLLRAQSIVPIIYLLFKEAINQNLLSRITRIRFDTFITEIQTNREKAEKDMANASFDLLEFDKMSQQGTNDASSIKERLKIMAEYFEIQPNIQY